MADRRMSDEVKITAIIVGGLLILAAGALGSCNYHAELDAKAPIVETCIKHPATQPLRGVQ